MAAKRKKELIRGAFFNWLIGQRNGVYFADGRSNRQNLGRHSLSTRSRSEALDQLKKLDRLKAVEAGIADNSILGDLNSPLLPLAEGRTLYMEHVHRPRIVGGARPASAKRYRPVFDKFETFAKEEGISSWNQVDRRFLEKYAAHLDDEGYAFATEYLELTTLKQVVKWLIEEKRLPASCAIQLALSKPQGTTTYCWCPEEFRAMIQLCAGRPELTLRLGETLTALACTGLRISELASLRWTDIDWDNNLIKLTDESTHRRRNDNARRQTKSGRSRSFPIHDELRKILIGKTRAKDGFIFHGIRDGRLKPDTVRNSLIRDILIPLSKKFPSRDAGVAFADGRLHSFRHYFCSMCANTGVPEQVVKEWLGHADSKMVRLYYHLHDEEAQRQMRRVNFFGSAGDNVAAGDNSSSAEDTDTQTTN